MQIIGRHQKVELCKRVKDQGISEPDSIYVFFSTGQRRIQDLKGGEGAPQPHRRRGINPLLAKFSWKQHENQENWAARGRGAHPKFVYVDPPLQVLGWMELDEPVQIIPSQF